MLAGISGLDLIAKTVVDGFVTGLHRSPDFGFSQEFAEYRAYAPGDDLRHVDWNLFARTERTYLKRYRGETNSQLTILLDASNSMNYSSQTVSKMDYARYIAASLCYLAIKNQRDPAGLIVFDDEVRDYIPPSTRVGQLQRLLASLEAAEPRARTNFGRPMAHLQGLLRRRGMVVVISDFYEDPAAIVKTIEPLRFHGSEVVLFHVLDPQEIHPKLKGPSILVDLETEQRLEVVPDYVKNEYRRKMDAHLEQMESRTRAAGMDYQLLVTDKPLDSALGSYLSARPGRKLMGFFAPWFLAGLAAVGLPIYIHLLRRHTTTPRPVSSLMFFERGTQSSVRHRRLRYLVLFTLRTLLVLLLALVFAQPFLRRSKAAASERLLVVVVDDSFSMRAGSRLADAKQQATEMLAKRPSAQHAQVMLLAGELQILTQAVTDDGALKAAVAGIQPGDSHGNFGELGRGMRRAGRDGPYTHRAASVQRHAGVQHAGQLCRHGDARQRHARVASGRQADDAKLERRQRPGSGATGGPQARACAGCYRRPWNSRRDAHGIAGGEWNGRADQGGPGAGGWSRHRGV